MVNLTAYPNPTSEMLVLRAENLESKTLEYKLFDSTGKLLKTEKLMSDICLISFSQYTAGVYFLNVISNTKQLKSFKIIRNE